MLDIKFKSIHKNAKLPSKAFDSDACFDLSVVSDDKNGWYTSTYDNGVKKCVIFAKERLVLRTGLICAIPAGHCLILKDRSGLAVKNGLHVLAGVIDEQYRGELLVCIINLSEGGRYTLVEGDRIAQAYLAPVIQARTLFVDELDETERGTGGIGSTGK